LNGRATLQHATHTAAASEMHTILHCQTYDTNSTC